MLKLIHTDLTITSTEITRASTAQILGVLASITERVHENRMWSKGHRDNCQYFIRKGNITQVKVNLNKRCKFLCHIYVSADKQGQLKRMREKTSSNVHNVNDALVPAETFGLFTHTWMWGKVKSVRKWSLPGFVDMEWQFLPDFVIVSPPPRSF